MQISSVPPVIAVKLFVAKEELATTVNAALATIINHSATVNYLIMVVAVTSYYAGFDFNRVRYPISV